MGLVLLLKNGPNEGGKYPVSDGLTIGRGESTIFLDDRKVSSAHAQVQMSPEDSLVLVDLGSTNGIRGPAGGRVKILELVSGVTFSIGDTDFEVIDTRERSPHLAHLRPQNPVENWREKLEAHIDDHIDDINNESKPLVAFKKAVEIKVIQGIQIDTKWVIGYGPRVFGRFTIGHQILEPEAPEFCFELSAKDEDVEFSTEHPFDVQFNGRSVKTSIIKDGDCIQIKDTRLRLGIIS